MPKDAEDLSDLTEQLIRDEPPTARAIKSLIEVKDSKPGEASEIELKTDITDDEQKIHAVLSIISQIIINKDMMKDDCILAPVILKLQRLALSKNRKSREEIVDVSRQPDMPMMGMGGMLPEQGIMKNMFTSRKNRWMR